MLETSTRKRKAKKNLKYINKAKKEGILHSNFHVWGGKLPSENVNVSVNIKPEFSCLV